MLKNGVVFGFGIFDFQNFHELNLPSAYVRHVFRRSKKQSELCRLGIPTASSADY